jgi:hypothetical protein
MKYLLVLLLVTTAYPLLHNELNDTIQCINDYVQTYRPKMVALPSSRTANISRSSRKPSPTP